LGKSDEAIEAYGNALGHDPNNGTALNNRAYHRALARKDLVEAAKDVEEAIEIDGEQPAFVDTRGYISYLRGDFKQALADFNQALRESEDKGDPKEFSAEILFHRGLVYKKLGEEDLAKKDFEKAKTLGFEATEYPEPVTGSL
jgi:tetratricopeptide (TPR) repeat protein